MKYTLISALIVLSVLGTTSVVAERGDRVAPEQRVARMTEHLNLSADQQTAVLELMEQTQAQREADREAGVEVDRVARREAFEAQLQQILTDEQFTQFQDRPQRDRRGGARPRRSE